MDDLLGTAKNSSSADQLYANASSLVKGTASKNALGNDSENERIV